MGEEQTTVDTQIQGTKGKMQLTELRKQLETEKNIEFHGNCHDCGASVEVLCSINENGEIVISGGAIYNPLNTKYFFKCDKCFQNDKVLRNWQKCEVYSRAIGYLRPVSQWNVGKQEEWKMRVNYTIPK